MADPTQNILSLTIPTDLLTGAGGGNGLTFSYNFGPNADTIAQNAYSFASQQAAGAMAFEGNAITGTQNFLSAQVSPIVQSVASEADDYFSQILGAFGQTTNVQNAVALQGISAENNAVTQSINASKKSQKGGSLLGSIFGGCFITTAVCKYSGLPDDCATLQTMRHWRDTWMRETEQRRRMVQDYYAMAPDCVARIEQLPESEQVYIWHELARLIERTCHYVRQGKHHLALAYYTSAVMFALCMSEDVDHE